MPYEQTWFRSSINDGLRLSPEVPRHVGVIVIAIVVGFGIVIYQEYRV